MATEALVLTRRAPAPASRCALTDDSFDMDAGYQGSAQFLFALLGRTGHHALEIDSASGDLPDYDSSPRSQPRLLSLTFIGGGGAGRNDSLVHVRSSASVMLSRAILGASSTAVRLDACSACQSVTQAASPSDAADDPVLYFDPLNLVGRDVAVPFALDAACAAVASGPAQQTCTGQLAATRANASSTPPTLHAARVELDRVLASVNVSECLAHDCLPAIFSPMPVAASAACLPPGGEWQAAPAPAWVGGGEAAFTFESTQCAGAFAHPSDDWLQGWSWLSLRGVVAEPPPPAPLAPPPGRTSRLPSNFALSALGLLFASILVFCAVFRTTRWLRRRQRAARDGAGMQPERGLAGKPPPEVVFVHSATPQEGALNSVAPTPASGVSCGTHGWRFASNAPDAPDLADAADKADVGLGEPVGLEAVGLGAVGLAPPAAEEYRRSNSDRRSSGSYEPERPSRSSSVGGAEPRVFDALAAMNRYRGYEEMRILGSGLHGRAVLLRSPSGSEFAVSKQVLVDGIAKDELARIEREVRALRGHELMGGGEWDISARTTLKKVIVRAGQVRASSLPPVALPPHRPACLARRLLSAAQVSILSRLSDPHIVTYRCCFQREQELCIVTEYAAGGTLRKLISQRAATLEHFSDGQLIVWLSQLTSALHAVHSAGYARSHAVQLPPPPSRLLCGPRACAPPPPAPDTRLHPPPSPLPTSITWHPTRPLAVRVLRGRALHRDLKPENIFLTERGEIKLGGEKACSHAAAAEAPWCLFCASQSARRARVRWSSAGVCVWTPQILGSPASSRHAMAE